MKKIIIAVSIAAIILFIAIAYFSINTAFRVVRPATAQINKTIVKDLSKVVIVPEGIALPASDFNQTTYSWEMETPAKEVSGVIFSYTPAFESNNDKIVASLSMPENGDPSIFNKVLEAIIVDPKSLVATRDPQKANIEATSGAIYNKITITSSPKTGQTTKITWEFDKKNLSQDLNDSYAKIAKYPTPFFKFLYKIPGFIVDLFRG